MSRRLGTLVGVMVAALSASGCAESRSSEPRASQREVDGPGRAGAKAADYRRPADLGSAGGPAIPPTVTQQPLECLGPGRHTRGKGDAGKTCCPGLIEQSTGFAGYSSGADGDVAPSCERPPLAVFGCVRGSCGDGICEEQGEAESCGCIADCPQAAFTWQDTARLSKLSAAPASCKREDLLARLQPMAAEDCGDLPLGAAQAERDASVRCARDAIAASRPFRMFWRVQGTDSIVHSGVVGKVESGSLQLFRLHVDADAFGINISGATASWWPCTPSPAPAGCDRSADDCLGCGSVPDSLICGCLPKGPRPGQEPGKTLELRCERQ